MTKLHEKSWGRVEKRCFAGKPHGNVGLSVPSADTRPGLMQTELHMKSLSHYSGTSLARPFWSQFTSMTR